MNATGLDVSSIVKSFGNSENDTGSIEVQIAILTVEIKNLTKHLLNNKKDFISKRGLFSKVSKRKALIKYLERCDIDRARRITQSLKDL